MTRLHFRGENVLDALFQQGVNGTEASGNILLKYSIVSNALKECGSGLVFFLGMNNVVFLASTATLSALGITLDEEMVCPRKSASVTPSSALEGGNLMFPFGREAFERQQVSATRAVESESKTMPSLR